MMMKEIKFAIYNYQFEPNLEKFVQLELKFPEMATIDAQESFNNRQTIFAKILQDDYDKTKEIDFRLRNRPYQHDHIMTPTDNLFVMRVANQRTTKITKKDFTSASYDDYPNCLVIVDNNPGVQRILIEQKSRAFGETMTVAKIVEATLNKLLRYWKLSISLTPIFRTSEFKKTIGDYPEGFRKIIIHLPHKNLDRVMENMEKSLADVREDWKTAMDISFIAPKGGMVPVDLNNERQLGLVKIGSAIGGASIEMIRTGKMQPSIWCGKDHLVTEKMDADIFTKMKNKDGEVNMFEEHSPLNMLKLALKQIKNRYD